MSEKFQTEPDRTIRFLSDVEPLISGIETEVPIESTHRLEVNPSQVDVSFGGIMLGGVKAEFSTGDPYMQVSRCYQAQAHKYLAQKQRNNGFPHLLISLIGRPLTSNYLRLNCHQDLFSLSLVAFSMEKRP
ncbi:hypothetical protein CPB86DRAFT_329586 [Serendipita vermifera]|nr:hypothetical protein CPB86DRAFT_329586 [Serendipita vermifera]